MRILEKRNGEKGRVRIAVSDTGSPIARGGKRIRLKDSGFTTGVNSFAMCKALLCTDGSGWFWDRDDACA